MEYIPSVEIKENWSEGICCSCLMQDGTIKQADDIIRNQFRETFKLEVEIEGFIFFICQLCLEKLKNAYHFFKQTELSIQFLTENQICKTENKTSIKNEENFYDEPPIQSEDNLSSEDDKPLVHLLKRNRIEKKRERRKKLQIVPNEEIEKEIENFKRDSFKLTSFTCFLCDYNGANRKLLASHMSSQHNFNEKNNNYCSVCNTQVEDLHQHKAIHKREWVCKFCGKSLRKKMEFVDHLKRHAENFCKCPVCLKKFLRQEDLDTHSILHENSKNSRFHCAKCDKGFKTEHFFDEHMEKHTRNACKKCGKDCRIPEQLLIHVCNLEQPLQHMVASSDKTDLFYNKTNDNTDIFESEFETHANEKDNLKTDDNTQVRAEELPEQKFQGKAFTCEICQRSYKSLGNLQAHIKGVHMNDYRFRCKFCNKGYVNRADVIIHENSVHSDTKLFICSTCGKGYATKGSLRTHMKLHGERNEVCHICEKTFCRKIDLEYHLKKHQGVKPHLCPDCGMAFAQKSHLTGHMTKHSDIRPFACPMCDKKFKKKELLKHHIKLHGEKPLKCPHCAYGCYKIYRLKCHMKMHDGDPFARSNQCQLCEKKFKNKFMLQHHLQVKHNAIIE